MQLVNIIDCVDVCLLFTEIFGLFLKIHIFKRRVNLLILLELSQMKIRCKRKSFSSCIRTAQQVKTLALTTSTSIQPSFHNCLVHFTWEQAFTGGASHCYLFIIGRLSLLFPDSMIFPPKMSFLRLVKNHPLWFKKYCGHVISYLEIVEKFEDFVFYLITPTYLSDCYLLLQKRGMTALLNANESKERETEGKVEFSFFMAPMHTIMEISFLLKSFLRVINSYFVIYFPFIQLLNWQKNLAKSRDLGCLQ
ncbi:hypothetical protein EGR_04518 [Echinococcus granulosus]|uniref:Uncharacterized protein n=1 Tax=Echinococcus granulosus TaxID=6210 RepID=W6UGP0_ECHGR|nr:hypothetical protein EGR_04518 [Echinococcus granulosus]EUB60685.1 hypothetical protein EGR_04518 [Echinococcus granulosus]